MAWNHLVSYFFGGLFLTNAIPHLVSATMGQPFQSPFARPSGEGLSSSTVNALWGSFNLAAAYLLLVHVGTFDVHNIAHVAVTGGAGVCGSVFLARTFGRFHGGNEPERVERLQQTREMRSSP
jgi:hypothetical protein